MLTIVHGVYKRNPYIEETLRLNLLALKTAKVKDFQYIVFNDKGDLLFKFDEKINASQIVFLLKGYSKGSRGITKV